MRNLFFLVVLLACFVQEALAQSAPPQLQVTSISANGSGCLSGQVAATISPDNQAFSLLFDDYKAESSASMALDRRACDVRVGLQIPAGWSYAIVSVDYRGFAAVDAGSVVTHQALYSFNGSKPKNERPGFQDSNGQYSFKQTQIRGPYAENYFIRNEISAQIAPWSACSNNGIQTLYISTYLMAQTQSRQPSSAMIMLDSVDGQVQGQTYRLVWKPCGSSSPVRPDPRRDLRPPRIRG